MENVHDFIRWALTHVKKESVPQAAQLDLATEACGREPWEYLFGSVKVKTTQATLDRYFEQHYCQQMSRADFDRITAGWSREGYATDCQGLCDAWWTYEADEKTDINANMNYEYWCTDKGRILDINRPYVVGEAVFMQASSGKMNHVGWICGFDENDEPLVVEARGIRNGVVITYLKRRAWTHRGLMTNVFSYEDKDYHMDEIKFELTSPLHRGDAYKDMQIALNSAGYRDNNGEKLEIDGIWGKKSQQAFDRLIKAHSHEPVTMAIFKSTCGNYRLAVQQEGDAE